MSLRFNSTTNRFPLVYNTGNLASPWTSSLITPLCANKKGIYWPNMPRGAYNNNSSYINYAFVWDHSTTSKVSWTFNGTSSDTISSTGDLWSGTNSCVDGNSWYYGPSTSTETRIAYSISYISIVAYTSYHTYWHTIGGVSNALTSVSGANNSRTNACRLNMDNMGAKRVSEQGPDQLCIGTYMLLRSNVSLTPMSIMDPGNRIWFSDSTDFYASSAKAAAGSGDSQYIMLSNSGFGGAYQMKELCKVNNYYYTLIYQPDFRVGYSGDSVRGYGAYGMGEAIMNYKYLYIAEPMVRLHNYTNTTTRKVKSGTIELLRSIVSITHFDRY